MVARPSPLPESVDAFLKLGSKRFYDLKKPAWLLNDVMECRWIIDFREGHSFDTRSPEFTINLSLYLPGVSEIAKAVLARQIRALLIAYFDSGFATSRTTQSAASVARILCWLSEFWAARASPRQIALGLGSLSADDVAEFALVYRDEGVSGILNLSGRWDSWVNTEIQIREREIIFFLDSISPEMKQAVENASHRSAGRYGLSFDHAFEAMALLAESNAYDASGRLRMDFVSAALEIPTIRVARNRTFKHYLRRYEIACDFERDSFLQSGDRTGRIRRGQPIEKRIERRDAFLLEELKHVLRYVSRAATRVAEFDGAFLARPTDLLDVLSMIEAPKSGRTPTIPIRTALQIISVTVDWLLNVSGPFEALSAELAAAFTQAKGGTSFKKAMDSAIAESTHPLIKERGVTSFWSKNRLKMYRSSENQSTSMSYSDLMDIHSAVCFTTIVLFGCLRRSEARDLVPTDLDLSDDLPYLVVGLRKRGVDGLHPLRRKPVPQIVVYAIESMNRLFCIWNCKSHGVKWNEHSIIWFLSQRGIRQSTDRTHLYAALNLMCEYLQIKDPEGNFWYIRPHEIRRCFAMSFFHYGGRENALPALTWLMGHRSIRETWLYVRSLLSGEETSSAEAQMATHAVFSQEKATSIERLRELLRTHFGCDDLLVMRETEVQEYLEMLHERGVYSATPIDIRTSEGVRVSVAIAIREEKA